MSDGLDTRSKITFETLFQKLSQFHIPVFTISLGNKTNNEVLKKIANKTGGRFYFSPGSNDLLSVYKKIAENLENAYMLKDLRLPAAAKISVFHLKIAVPRFDINMAYDFIPADSVFKEQIGVKKNDILKIIAGKNIYFTFVLALIILTAILFTWFYFSNRHIVLKLIMTLSLLILYLVLQFIVYFYIKI